MQPGKIMHEKLATKKMENGRDFLSWLMDESDMEKHAGRKQGGENTLSTKGFHESPLNLTVAALLIDNPLTNFCVLKQLMNIIIHKVIIRLT